MRKPKNLSQYTTAARARAFFLQIANSFPEDVNTTELYHCQVRLKAFDPMGSPVAFQAPQGQTHWSKASSYFWTLCGRRITDRWLARAADQDVSCSRCRERHANQEAPK